MRQKRQRHDSRFFITKTLKIKKEILAEIRNRASQEPDANISRYIESAVSPFLIYSSNYKKFNLEKRHTYKIYPEKITLRFSPEFIKFFEEHNIKLSLFIESVFEVILKIK